MTNDNLFCSLPSPRNVVLIYGTGITIGILASVIVLLYILGRYIPGVSLPLSLTSSTCDHCSFPFQRNFCGFGFLLGGYTFIGSLLFWFFNNILEICQDHWQYLLGYVVVAGLVSFALMYRWGTVSDPKTFDLIQWSIQLLGVCAIYNSTPSRECAIALLIITYICYIFPLRCVWSGCRGTVLPLCVLLELDSFLVQVQSCSTSIPPGGMDPELCPFPILLVL